MGNIDDKEFVKDFKEAIKDENTKKLIEDMVNNQINPNLINCEHGIECSHLTIMQVKKLFDLINPKIWTNLINVLNIKSIVCNEDGSCKSDDITNETLMLITNKLIELYPQLSKELLIYEIKK